MNFEKLLLVLKFGIVLSKTANQCFLPSMITEVVELSSFPPSRNFSEVYSCV